MNDKRKRTQPGAKWNGYGCQWNDSGRNADGRTKKERVRVKNDIFIVPNGKFFKKFLAFMEYFWTSKIR